MIGEHRIDPDVAPINSGQVPITKMGNVLLEKNGKDPAAAALGRKGGVARAAAMSPERRKEIAKVAAAKRWKKS